jgi:hypothetical protein
MNEDGFIKFDDEYPTKFPCKGRNYDLHVEDIITGIDENNKAFKHACFCKSLPNDMSMPFTHWAPLE